MNVFSKVDDGEVLGALTRLLALGRNPAPVMMEVAAIGESATRMRFRTETAPDGSRWKPSLRVQLSGGRTLTKERHLSGSVSSRSDNTSAQWGVNRIYAAIHQFGGDIKAKSGGALRFRLAGGGFVMVKKVTIPARPFLGISNDDREDILDAISRRILGVAHAG